MTVPYGSSLSHSTPTPEATATPTSRPFTLSDSQCNSWLRCQQAWKFRYVDKIKMAPSWAPQGRAAHAAEEVNYKQKLVTHQDLPVSDVQDAAATAFDAEVDNGDQQIVWAPDEDKGLIKDRTVRGVTAYHGEIAPQVQPIMVEEEVNLNLPWGTRLTGRMDIVDQDTTIRDTKHVSYAPRKGDDTYQSQPGLYGWIYRELTGDIPRFKLDYVILGRKDVKNPRTTPTQTVETEVTTQRIELALRKVKAVDGQIRTALASGDVAPNASAFNCAGCGYRSICPYAFKG